MAVNCKGERIEYCNTYSLATGWQAPPNVYQKVATYQKIYEFGNYILLPGNERKPLGVFVGLTTESTLEGVPTHRCCRDVASTSCCSSVTLTTKLRINDHLVLRT